jgi:predicted dehydrogenase
MNKVTIGVIGAGVLGSFHLQKCLKNPDVTVCGFYDISEERRRAVAEKLGVVAFETPQVLINACEALIIATPSSTHVDMAMRCLDAGKHALVEKPLAPSYEQGRTLVARAKERGVVLHVGHSEAFNAAFVKLLASQPRPKFIEIHRLAQFSPRGIDVPVVLDLMVHDLQLLLRLCREEPLYDRIAATGVPVISDDVDIANARIPFPSGCVVNLTASRISAKRMRKLRLFERDNYYSVDLDKEEIEHYSLTSAQAPSAGAAAAAAGPIAYTSEVVPHVDALESELAAFVGEIRGLGLQAGVKGDEALVVLKTTDMILSLISRNPVS